LINLLVPKFNLGISKNLGTRGKEDRYPNPNYFLPPREEIKEILEFTENLFKDVCKILDIDKQEIIIMGGLK